MAADDELRRLGHHFEVVTGLMAGALLVTDTSGVVRKVNPATLKMLGYDEDELVGRPVAVLFPESEGRRETTGVGVLQALARREGVVQRRELEAVTKEGERVPVAVSASPTRGSDGEILGTVLVGTDLREVRRLLEDAEAAERERARSEELGQAYEELQKRQERLIQTEKMASLDRLSAGVAHEINNPLGGIVAYAHLLKEMLPDDGPENSYVDVIIREATRCRDIVRGLLDFARVSRGTAEPHDVNEVIADALSLVSGQSLFLNIDTVVRYAPELPTVRVDRNHLQQAFFNIIYNAAQAMSDEGGRLDVETSQAEDGDGRWVRVRFSDTGPGIPNDQQNVIFEPFFTTKDIGEGTGLGLAVVRGIVTQYGGRIELESAPGEGATFIIALPVIRDERGPSRPA